MVMRVKLRWSGFQGGPGYSVFHFMNGNIGTPTVAEVDLALGKVKTFAEAIKNMIPANTSLLVENDVEELTVSSGQLDAIVTGTAQTVTTSTTLASTTYSAASGAVITWRTPGVRNGRRVRGRTFLVPLQSAIYQNDGTIDNGFVTGISNAAAALRTPTSGVRLVVYARPTTAAPGSGDVFDVTSHSVPDRVAILKSRRD
jgi:hypothetical protein